MLTSSIELPDKSYLPRYRYDIIQFHALMGSAYFLQCSDTDVAPLHVEYQSVRDKFARKGRKEVHKTGQVRLCSDNCTR
jgi:hypothetical protein